MLKPVAIGLAATAQDRDEARLLAGLDVRGEDVVHAAEPRRRERRHQPPAIAPTTR